MSENVFSRESNPGPLFTGQMPSHLFLEGPLHGKL